VARISSRTTRQSLQGLAGLTPTQLQSLLERGRVDTRLCRVLPVNICRTMPGVSPCRVVQVGEPGDTGTLCRVMPESGHCRTMPTAGTCRVMPIASEPGAAGHCRVMPGEAGNCRVMPGDAGNCRVMHFDPDRGTGGGCRVLPAAD
jgi:hypothetical protein